MYENKHIEYFFIPLETQRELSFSDPNFIEKFRYISKLSLQSDRNPVPKMQIVRWVFKLVLILSLYNMLISEAIAQTASQQEQDQEQAPAAACSEADRVSLLGFKARILKDTTDILSSWTGRDCCGGGWEGVQCNPATGRVTGLTLQRPASSDKYSALYMKGTLSPSLGSLQFLEVMVISGMKHIAGTIPQSFSNLTGLTLLVMEDNSLQGDIPSSLGHLPLLRILSLSGNRLIGQIPPSLGNLRNLIQLNLARNSLTGPIPPSSKNFLSLQSLDLSYNSLSGLIPAFIGQYRNLSFLDLSNNQLSGQIPNLLCELANLLDLSLSHNQLTGTIPDQIGNVKSLTTLSLSFNKLSGQIPESISRLQNLWYLNLSSNQLSNPLPTTLSKGIPSLLSIDLSYNSLNLGTIPEWIRSRQLSDVHLAGCNLKGTLPNFTKPDSLISVDLSDNYFTDGISNFFVKMSSLQKVKLSNNQLKSDLSGIAILPDGLSSLDLRSNQLSGSLSGVLNNKTSSFLEAIDVSSNQISGSIPEFNGGLSLKIFNIGSNKITGHIPSSISNLIQLERFDISRNQITGTIPTSLGLLVKMQWLDLSINGLTGRIPESLLGIENLRHANQAFTMVAANDVLLDSSVMKYSPADCQRPEVLNKNLVKGNILVCGYSFNFVVGTASIKQVSETAKSLGAIGFVLAVENVSPGTKFDPVPVGVPGIVITDVSHSMELIDYYNISTSRDWTGRVKSFKATGGIGDGLVPILHKSAPQVALFSSRGPNIKDYGFQDADLLKPDILAPGSLIWSAWAPNGTDEVNYIGEGFAVISGTSMSAPHIAGIAALIKQKHPHWSPAAIKSALMTTSTTVDRAERPLQAQQYSGSETITLVAATPFDYGSGHVNPRAALDPGLIFDAGYEDYLGFLCTVPGIDAHEIKNYTNSPCNYTLGNPSNFNTPSVTISHLAKTRTVTRTVTNVALEEETYVITARMAPAVAIETNPPAMTLRPGGSRKFTVTLTVRSVTGAYSFGEVLMKGSRGHKVRIPVVAMGYDW